MINPEIGFTSDVIKDPSRFVGRADLIRNCIRAINTPLGLLAVYGKRGVGKSSLLRQVQQMALGDYILAKRAGLHQEVPSHPRTYLTVFYSCDATIGSGVELLNRMCNDQDDEDGLLRLVPDEGKELSEFTRSKETHIGADLKVVNWGAKGIESTKYAKVVPNDIVQTFRNFVNAVRIHQVKKRMNRSGLLILLDEFDVIKDKAGIGSLIKSLSSDEVKFGICGIGSDLADLVEDHASVERLLEQGAIDVGPMDPLEAEEILHTAERLFEKRILFDHSVKTRIAELSEGFPYLTQLIGKTCVEKANEHKTQQITESILGEVLENIKNGDAFPTLEHAYKRAIGQSEDRQLLLHLLAEQPREKTLFTEDFSRVFLKKLRKDAEDFDISYVDQLMPRLIAEKYGPVLRRVPETPGIYEFVNPVFRLYVRLRAL